MTRGGSCSTACGLQDEMERERKRQETRDRGAKSGTVPANLGQLAPRIYSRPSGDLLISSAVVFHAHNFWGKNLENL